MHLIKLNFLLEACHQLHNVLNYPDNLRYMYWWFPQVKYRLSSTAKPAATPPSSDDDIFVRIK